MSTRKIYKIINNIDGKLYIGKTIKDLKTRFEEHITTAKRWAVEDLVGKKHPYRSRLYPAMNKHDYYNFRIELIEELSASCQETLEAREKYWINFFNTTDDQVGYNISPGGCGGPLFKGHRHTNEMKQKQSLQRKGIKQDSKFIKYRTRNIPRYCCQCLETKEFFNKIKDTGHTLIWTKVIANYPAAYYKGNHFIKTVERLSTNTCDALLAEIKKQKLFISDGFNFSSNVEAMHNQLIKLRTTATYKQKIKQAAITAGKQKQKNYWNAFILKHNINIEQYKANYFKYKNACPNRHLELLYKISYTQVRGLNKYFGLKEGKSGHKNGKVIIEENN